jgi:hypothetical protein
MEILTKYMNIITIPKMSASLLHRKTVASVTTCSSARGLTGPYFTFLN